MSEEWGRGLLAAAVGLRLRGLARGHYVRGCHVERSRGPLELAFEGELVLNLTTASNAESVWVRPGRWSDPLADPDARAGSAPPAGAWARLDSSSRPEFARLLGSALQGLRWLANPHGSIAAVELRFGGGTLTFASWGDDEYVVSGDAAALPPAWGMRPVDTDSTHPAPA